MADAAEDLSTQNADSDAGGQGTQDEENQGGQEDTQPSNWYSDDWQTKLAGDDEKALKQLQRFKDPSALWSSYQEANRKISSGEYKMTSLPENATPEEVNAFQQMHGIPESPDKYEVNFDGVELSDNDKKYLGGFYDHAHANNIPKAHVEAMAKWHYEQNIPEQIKALDDSDQAYAEQSEDVLRKEWGDDYRMNAGIVKNMLDGAPEEVREDLLEARLGNGEKLKHSPQVLNWLVDIAKEINPAATVVPNIGTDSVEAIQDEINKLVKLSGDRSSEYWKGPNAQKNQDRLLELNGVIAKINAKG